MIAIIATIVPVAESSFPDVDEDVDGPGAVADVARAAEAPGSGDEAAEEEGPRRKKSKTKKVRLFMNYGTSFSWFF